MIAPPSDGLVDRPLALSPADIRLYSSMSVACGMLCKRRQSHSGGQSEPAHKQTMSASVQTMYGQQIVHRLPYRTQKWTLYE